MLIVIATLLIGAPIAIIIKVLWTILLAFLLVVALCSWWYRNWRRITVVVVFVATGFVLLLALANDCRYSCQQWQSTGLDILATLASFSMGMILTRALDSATMPLNNWVKGSLWLAVLLVIGTVVILIPGSDLTQNSAAVFIWALGLPVLGVAAKRIWPWLF